MPWSTNLEAPHYASFASRPGAQNIFLISLFSNEVCILSSCENSGFTLAENSRKDKDSACFLYLYLK